MKKSKIMCGTLCASFMVSLFAGCGGTEKSSVESITAAELNPEKIGSYSTLKLPLDDKGTTISVLCDTSFTNLSDSVVVKELSRRTGLNVQIIEVPRATVKEKARVMLASKEQMPDIFSGGFTVEEINDVAMQGVFEPINPHIDELPNFKDIFVTNGQENGVAGVFKNYAAADGNLYMFPSFETERDVNHGILYRKDIFDKNGIPMWNSTQEFYEALKKLKTVYPQSTPFVSKARTSIFNQLGQSWGLNFPDEYYDEETATWKHSVTDPKFKDLLDFMKKMYQEKLLDPEFLTCTQANWTTKMTQEDKAFATFDWIGRLDSFYDQSKALVPGYDLRYGNPIGPTGKVITLPKAGPGPVAVKGKNSALSLKLMDYLISPSGAQLMTMGVEGQTYQLNEKGFAEYLDMPTDHTIGITDLEEKYGMFLSGLYRRFDKRCIYFNLTDKEKEAQDLMRNKPDGGFLPEDPVLTFTAEEKKRKTDCATKIQKAAYEFVSKYVLNSGGNAEWTAWLAQAENIGAKEVITICNQAQERYNNK